MRLLAAVLFEIKLPHRLFSLSGKHHLTLTLPYQFIPLHLSRSIWLVQGCSVPAFFEFAAAPLVTLRGRILIQTI
jgi:hypothetical protein